MRYHLLACGSDKYYLRPAIREKYSLWTLPAELNSPTFSRFCQTGSLRGVPVQNYWYKEPRSNNNKNLHPEPEQSLQTIVEASSSGDAQSHAHHSNQKTRLHYLHTRTTIFSDPRWYRHPDDKDILSLDHISLKIDISRQHQNTLPPAHTRATNLPRGQLTISYASIPVIRHQNTA